MPNLSYDELLRYTREDREKCRRFFAGTPEAMREWLAAFYGASRVVRMGAEPAKNSGAELLLRRSAEPNDALELHVFASPDGAQARLVAVLDNLGKGASGAAVQSLNLMAGLDETASLRL